MVHFLGHYYDPTAFWTMIAILGAGVYGLVFYLFTAWSKQAERIDDVVDTLTTKVGQIQWYLDGLPKSEDAVRKPFEEGMAALHAFKWDEVIGHFTTAMTHAAGTRLVALLNLIGLCHYALCRWQQALAGLEESASLADLFQDSHGKAAALGNMGLVFRAQGELDKALQYQEEGLAIARGVGYQRGAATALGNMGNIHLDKGEFDKAIEYLESGLSMDREIGDPQGEASTLGNVRGRLPGQG